MMLQVRVVLGRAASRLDVTIQSLLWNQPRQYDTSSIEALRNEINITQQFTLDDVFGSRRSVRSGGECDE